MQIQGGLGINQNIVLIIACRDNPVVISDLFGVHIASNHRSRNVGEKNI